MRRAALVLAIAAALVVAALGALVVLIDVGDHRALVAGAVERATGRELVIAGPLRPRVFTLRPALVATDITLANAPWGSRPHMIRLRRLEAVLSLPALLRGDVVVRELVLIEPDVLLETDAAGNGNWLLGPAPSGADGGGGEGAVEPASDAAGLPAIQRLRIERGTLAYRDGRTGGERRGTLRAARIDSDGTDGPVHVTAELDANGEPLHVKATLGPGAALAAGRGPWPIAFEAAVGNTRLAASGEIALATPLRVRLAVEAPRLDLADLTAGYGDDKSGRIFGEAPLPIAALAGLDAALALRVDELDGLTDIRLYELAGEVRIAEGVLTVGPLTGRAGGAPLEATARLAPAGEAAELTARLRLEQADLGEIVREISGQATLTGPVDLAAELRGHGRSMAEVMATADGRATVVSGAGRLHNAFFEFLSADVVRAVTPWAPRQAPTEVRCGVGRFDFRGGVGRSRIIVLDTDRATVIGEGVIDLRSEALDLLFEPTTKDLSALSVAALVPVRVHGRIADPTVEPAAGAAVTETATAVLEGAVDAARWVGSRLGVTGGPRGAADPCPRARAVALGSAAGAAPPPADAGKDGPLQVVPEAVDRIKRLFD